MIRVSDRIFELLLTDGQKARAVWAEQTIVPLGEYLGREVVIEGQAVFRPSGTLLRIDAEAIAAAARRDEFFSRLPHASGLPRKQLETAAGIRPGKSGFAAIYGQWPGDESDEEILTALEELS
jgi:hypothetical protein